MQPGPETLSHRQANLRLTLVLFVAGFFAIAVFFHLFSVNSDYYYVWQWKISPGPTVFPVLFLLAIPFFMAQVVYARKPSLLWLALVLITLGSLAMMIGAAFVQKDPPSFSRITDVVESRWSTGYFLSAVKVVQWHLPIRELLRQYPTLLDRFYLHPRQKPPGLLLFQIALVHVLGSGDFSAMMSGLLTGFIAALGVPATFYFITIHTQSRDAGFFGASFFALCPSLILFFPDFDPCFPVCTASLAILWALALRKNNPLLAAAFGLLYAFWALFTYLVGLLPIFFFAYTLVLARNDPGFRWRAAFRHLFISLASFAAFYLVLWAFTRFDPIATLRQCIRENDLLWYKLIHFEEYPSHSLPLTVFTDLYDFALGSAWISFCLAGFYVLSTLRTGFSPRAQIALASVCQFLLIALAGLLQTEAARIWIFMYPFLMLPIGLELASWPPKHRLAVYVALLVITAALCRSVVFMTDAV